MKRYKIVRFEFPDCFKSVEVIKRNLSLEEAQAHCKREDTHEKGVWFDGYEEQK